MRQILNSRLQLIVGLLLCNLSHQSLHSQDIDSVNLNAMSIREVRQTARHAERLGDAYLALGCYGEWLKRKPDNNDVKFKYGILLKQARNYAEAEQVFQELTQNASGEFPTSRFYLAEMKMSQGKYDEAKNDLLKFKKELRNVTNRKYRKLCKSMLSGIELAKNEAISDVIVSRLDSTINNPHVEFSPISVDEESMIYGSLKANKVKYYDIDKHDSLEIPLRKFYEAKKVNDKWVPQGELKGPFNSEDAHVGNGAFSADGKRFYFTKCKKNWQNKIICKLYYSERNGSNWSKATEMNALINIPDFTTTQPTVGRESKKNREVIYFVSDRPGGKGGLDIWYTEYNPRKKTYKKPRNAGSKINTVGDEMTPFYDLETRTLYFSSNGKPGFGGLDVYHTEGERGKWQPAINAGKGINTGTDELDYTLNHNKKGGFFVSNREGGSALLNKTCCDDIYSFEFSKYLDINVGGSVKGSNGCIKGFEVNLYIKNEEGRYLAKTVNPTDCKYNLEIQHGIDYEIEFKKDGYFNYVDSISTKTVDSSTSFDKEIQMQKIPEQPIVLPGIYFEMNSAKLTPAAVTALDSSLVSVLVANPRLIVKIESHTDSKGSDKYNQKLSEKRAKSVVKHIVSKGIHKERLRSEGHGESRPVAPNTHPDGSDNPEGRQMNRRTEFTIISKLSDEQFEKLSSEIE